MHHIPLWEKDAYLVDVRELSECKAMRKVANVRNINESIRLLHTMMNTDKFSERYHYEWAGEAAEDAMSNLANHNLDTQLQGMKQCHDILQLGIKHGPAITSLLLMRSFYCVRNKYWTYSVVDSVYVWMVFKRLLPLCARRTLCGSLALAMYFLGDFYLCKKFLNAYLRSTAAKKDVIHEHLGIDELILVLMHDVINFSVKDVLKDVLDVVAIESFLKENRETIEQFGSKDELEELEELVALMLAKGPPGFKGFKYQTASITQKDDFLIVNDPNTAAASGVKTVCEISKQAIVLIEDPDCKHLDMPFLMCHFCFRFDEVLYPCLECGHRSYCSLQCNIADTAHTKKCKRARAEQLIMNTFDGVKIFEPFLALMEDFNTMVENSKFKSLKCSGESYFNAFLKTASEAPYINCKKYLRFLHRKPDYKLMTFDHYKELQNKAFRLSIYAIYFVSKLNARLESIPLQSTELEIFISAILLRLFANFEAECIRVHFTFPIEENQCMPKPVSVSIFDPRYSSVTFKEPSYWDYFKEFCASLFFKLKSEDFRETVFLMSKPTSGQIPLILKNAYAELSFEEQLNAVKSYTWWYHRLKSAYPRFLWEGDRLASQMLSGLYTKIRHVRHSDKPNMVIQICLVNGIIKGCALRDIAAGEEITIDWLNVGFGI